MNTKKPFVITNCHKRNFRDWVKEQFPDIKRYSFHDSRVYPALKERFDEVHTAAGQVFGIMMTHSDIFLQRYYAQDQTKLNEAHEKRDVKAYASALDAFIDAIDVE